tara:strand:- start:976 stop:1452 length:477 start_codon:yes stop_codon:yes gene_type:complete
MFTTVNSAKKNSLHSNHLDAGTSTALINSGSQINYLSILKRLSNFYLVNSNYLIIQLAIISLTFIISLILSLSTSIFISGSFGLSLFIGSVVGIFYLRLLAKSIGNLGKTSSGVSKVQLLLPICLFIFASKNEFIEILPAVIGFFLYKPALFFYFSRP